MSWLLSGNTVDEGEGWQHAVRLAERLNAPVWAGPEEGRPGFPETHPLYRGQLPPAIRPLSDRLDGHDLIIVLGAPVFRYYPYVAGDYIPAGAHLVHITDNGPGGDAAVSSSTPARGNSGSVAPRLAKVTSNSQSVAAGAALLG